MSERHFVEPAGRFMAALGSLAMVLLAAAAEPEPAWKAAASKTRITPEEPMWMSGYASRDHPAEGTRTELWAKALALEDAAGKRAVVVTLDLVGLDRGLAAAIREEARSRWKLDDLALCSSHTHTGPVVRRNLETMYFFGTEEEAKVRRYADGLQESVLQAVGEALSKLAPAQLAWAKGHETFAVNRRNNPEPLVPAWRAAGQLKGPVDYEVPVLRVANQTNQIVAVVFGYACHATVLSDYLWSGDYPGYAQIELEKTHPNAVALFVTGCGADINPLPRRTPELAQSYGKRLADAASRALDGVLQPVAPRLRTAYREIDLPLDELPTREEFEKESASENRYIAARAGKFLRLLDAGQAIDKTYPYPVSVWQLGDNLTWIALGGEVVVDFSLRLKRELGSNLWVAGYSHDVMAYIPSLRVWKEGGYEGATAMIYYGLPARWAPSVEELVVEEVHRQVKSLSE